MGKVREKSENVLKSLKKSWRKKLEKLLKKKWLPLQWLVGGIKAGKEKWHLVSYKALILSHILSHTRLFILSHILSHTRLLSYSKLYFEDLH